MSSKLSEDLQPNEIRQSRKGNSAVPAILPTRPGLHWSGKPAPLSYHHNRSIYDGTPASTAEFRSSYMPMVPALRKQAAEDTRSTINLVPAAVDHRPLHKHSLFVRGSADDFVKQPKPHPHSAKKRFRPGSKRREIDGTETHIPLPRNCRKGVEGNKRNRQQWMAEQISLLEAEQKVVLKYWYLNSSVGVLYRATDRPENGNPSYPDEAPSRTGVSTSFPLDLKVSDGCPGPGVAPNTAINPSLPIVEPLKTLYPPVMFRSGTMKTVSFVWRPPNEHQPIQGQTDTPPSIAMTTNESTFTAAPSSSSPQNRDTESCQSSEEEIDELVDDDQVIHIAMHSADKPRLVLLDPSVGSSNHIFSVTMRGALSSIHRNETRSDTHNLLPGTSVPGERVDDACLIPAKRGSYIAIGHVRDSRQIGLYDVTHDKARHVVWLERPLDPSRKGGISSMCTMTKPGMFASGGYDHRVHLWTIPSNPVRTSSEMLSIKHSSVVNALLPVKDTSHKLLTGGADCIVNVFELSSERVVNTFKTSNSVFQLHPSLSEFCTLLEVAHRDLQFEIRDRRLVPEDPVQRFGYKTTNFPSRYSKGSVRSTTFASGDANGSVRFWDFRKLNEPYSTVDVFPGRRIKQVLFNEAELVVCSEDLHLKFIQVPSGDIAI